MLDLAFPRDLLMTGAIFGVVAFVWSGWAQERPPAGWRWRIVLWALGLGGIILAAVSIPSVVQHWAAPTAIVFQGPAWNAYLIACALEVIAIAVAAVWATRARRADLIAPLALAVVGIHFVPLAFVFGQPIMGVTGVVLTVIAVVSAFVPTRAAARSFWCGVLAAPVFLIVGAICLVAGRAALSP